MPQRDRVTAMLGGSFEPHPTRVEQVRGHSAESAKPHRHPRRPKRQVGPKRFRPWLRTSAVNWWLNLGQVNPGALTCENAHRALAPVCCLATMRYAEVGRTT